MLLRYPGGKNGAVAREIVASFHDSAFTTLFRSQQDIVFISPFLGGGGVELAYLSQMSMERRPVCAYLSDASYGVCSIWWMVRDEPDRLIDACERFRPSVEEFFRLKEVELSSGFVDMQPLEAAVSKLAVHRMSYSGLGCMAGGPIGGRDQSGEYDVGCRWNVDRLEADIRKCHRILAFHKVDIAWCLWPVALADSPEVMVYLDPPYVGKGQELYVNSFGESDHRSLSQRLSRLRSKWLLSYDDHELVRDIYGGFYISSLKVTYTGSRGANRKTQELLISNYDRRSCEIPCLASSVQSLG